MVIRVDDPIGCVISGIDGRWVDFPDLGAEGERDSGNRRDIRCAVTLIAPSLPPVMSSNSAGSVPRVTIEESTMPE
jgi:hypothetical protein